MVRSGTPTTMIDRLIWRYHLWRGRRAVLKAVRADQARQLMAEREVLKGAPAVIEGLERLLGAAAADPRVRKHPGGPRERRYRR